MRLSSYALFIGLSTLSLSALASNYRGLTEQFIHSPSNTWQWSDFTQINEVTWETSTPVKNSNNNESYQLDSLKVDSLGDFEWSMFNVYGTKKNPTALHFQAHDENGELYDKVRTTLFNPQRLKKIDSNCTTEVRKFFVWKRTGFKPLYIYQEAYGGKYGSFYDVNIYEDFDEMNKTINETASTPTFHDDSGNIINSCQFYG